MIFGASNLNEFNKAQVAAVVENFIIDDISRGDSEDIKRFCESAEAQVLVEKQVLKKPTLMRLSKADDQKRRTKLTAFQLAKDANDPLWAKLQKNRKQEKQLIGQIMKKYGAKAQKLAAIAQKDYIKVASKGGN